MRFNLLNFFLARAFEHIVNVWLNYEKIPQCIDKNQITLSLGSAFIPRKLIMLFFS